MSKYSDAEKAKYYKALLSKQQGLTQVVRKAKPAAKKAAKPKKTTRKPSSSRGSKYAPYAAMAGGTIGSYFGGPLGGALGSAAGGMAADIFKSITGIGDYKVVSNSLVNPSDSVPMFRNGKRITLVEHREYIQDIVSSATPGAFKIESFDINAGNAACFPWLSEVAENYEQYRVHGMVFQFKSQSADALNSTNTALGTVVMATQYNMLNPAFTNKQQMENYEFGCSSRPSCDLLHPVECDPGQTAVNGLFSTRLGGAGSTGDPRLYDLGRFNIATVGMQGASVNIGELWVTYQIELLKPRLGDAADLIDHYRATTGVTTSAFFGTDAVLSGNSDFGTTLGPTTITIPNSFTGNLLVIYALYGAAGSGYSDPVITASAGASANNLLSGNIFNQFTDTYATGTVATKAMALVSCVNGGTLTFAGGVLPNTITNMDLMVMAMPSYTD